MSIIRDITERMREFLELGAFGVCTELGKKLGIASKHIRLFFLYSTFIATWSPFILYLILAFWMNMKNYINEQRHRIWE